jgi:hypothetical protein
VSRQLCFCELPMCDRCRHRATVQRARLKQPAVKFTTSIDKYETISPFRHLQGAGRFRSQGYPIHRAE